jgi:protease IV
MSHASEPVRVVQVTPARGISVFGWILRLIFLFILLISMGANIVLLLALVGVSNLGLLSVQDEETTGLIEHVESGDTKANDKVAIIDVEGVLMEGMTGFAQKQIERAARDSRVKAIVLRIQSPGGSITASDHLYHLLVELRDGNKTRGTFAKPIVVSMGSLAASGGYYIAMPGQRIFAERTTTTGSIGVYAALPNVKALSDKIGFRMDVIKAGEVKDSGSPFADMTEKEKLMWQHLVDESYLQFLHVVEEGRPKLKGKLQEDVKIDETVPVRTEKGMEKKVNFTRYRADGGVYTSPEALKLGLIDQIGYLDEAIESARQAAKLGTDFKAVRYERPVTLLGYFLGVKSPAASPRLELSALADSATPRLWYLSSGSGAAGVLAAAGRE